MADKTSGGHPAMDYAEHNRTYSAFLGWTKFGVIAIVAILVAMKVFLVH